MKALSRQIPRVVPSIIGARPISSMPPLRATASSEGEEDKVSTVPHHPDKQWAVASSMAISCCCSIAPCLEIPPLGATLRILLLLVLRAHLPTEVEFVTSAHSPARTIQFLAIQPLAV